MHALSCTNTQRSTQIHRSKLDAFVPLFNLVTLHGRKHFTAELTDVIHAPVVAVTCPSSTPDPSVVTVEVRQFFPVRTTLTNTIHTLPFIIFTHHAIGVMHTVITTASTGVAVMIVFLTSSPPPPTVTRSTLGPICDTSRATTSLCWRRTHPMT